MKSILLREIAKTIRALEEFAVDWEKHFPENGAKAFRATARMPRRRITRILTTPPRPAAAKGMNHTNHRIGGWRVGKRRAYGEQGVSSGE